MEHLKHQGFEAGDGVFADDRTGIVRVQPRTFHSWCMFVRVWIDVENSMAHLELFMKSTVDQPGDPMVGPAAMVFAQGLMRSLWA